MHAETCDVEHTGWRGKGMGDHHLQHEFPGFCFSEPLLAFDKLEHGLLRAELHDNVDVLLVFKHFFKLDNVLVVKTLVNFDLGLELYTIAKSAYERLTQKRRELREISTREDEMRHK